jgi:hypothetical protein
MQNMTSTWATGTYELMLQKDEDNLLLTVFAVTADPDSDDWDTPILAQVEIEPDGEPAVSPSVVRVGGEGKAPEELEFILGPRVALRALMVLHEAALQDARGLDFMDAPWRAPSPERVAVAEALAERFNDTGLLLATRLFHM